MVFENGRVEYLDRRDAWLLCYKTSSIVVQSSSPLWGVSWRVRRLVNRVDSGSLEKMQERNERKEKRILDDRRLWHIQLFGILTRGGKP